MNRRCSSQFDSQQVQFHIQNGPLHRQYHTQLTLDRSYRIAKFNRKTTSHGDLNSTEKDASPQRLYAYRLQQLRHRHAHNTRRKSSDPKPKQDRQQIDSHYSDKQAYNDNRTDYLSDIEIPLYNGTRLPTPRTQTQKYPIPMRLLWFRTDRAQQPKISTLLNRFGNEGMDIQVIEDANESSASAQRLVCELIMLECINTVEQELLTRLNTVREGNRIPLIVLTDNHTLDWSLLALREGADAIFTLNTPDDIIIARSNALLRRWISE
jgi:hypothetical protein